MKRTQANSLSILIFLFIFFLITSCGTVSAAYGQESTSESIDSLVPSWKPLYDSIDGFNYFAGRISSPRLEFHALRIDLQNPQLEIFVAAGERSVKTSSFVRDNKLLAGINALPFDPASAREGEKRTNIGIVISNYEVFSSAHSSFDSLVFFEDGRAEIMPQSRISSGPPRIKNAVGGFYTILKNGEPMPRVLEIKTRHPRSAAGISSNGRYLYLLVIDGRRYSSIGSTEEETALILKKLGAVDGINFDGGGSSAMAIRFPEGNVRVLNTPIHGGIAGRERAVAGCLGIRLKD